MKSNRIALALMLSLVATVAAQAQFTWIDYTDEAVPGRVYDLYVDYEGTTPIVEMLTDFAPGQIFQDPAGAPAGGPPNAALLGIPGFEALQFDTFITLGSVTADNPADPLPLLIVGGAVDIGGQPMAIFDENQLNVTWSPGGGVNIPNTNPGGLGELMARVTLFDAAQGTITLLLQDASGSTGPVMFVIPEPSSIAMLALGLLGFLSRRV